MHQNSLKAFKEIDTSERKRMILGFYERYRGYSYSDREVMESLDFSDMNFVRPRITELIKEGYLKETGNKKDYFTGRTVREVTIVEKEGELF